MKALHFDYRINEHTCVPSSLGITLQQQNIKRMFLFPLVLKSAQQKIDKERPIQSKFKISHLGVQMANDRRQRLNFCLLP